LKYVKNVYAVSQSLYTILILNSIITRVLQIQMLNESS